MLDNGKHRDNLLCQDEKERKMLAVFNRVLNPAVTWDGEKIQISGCVDRAV